MKNPAERRRKWSYRARGGGLRGWLAETGWEVAHSLCWILLVIGVRRTGNLLQPPYLTLSSTIVILLINTDLILTPTFVLPTTVVIQLILIAVIRPAHPSLHHLPLLQPRKLWRNVEEGCQPIARDVGPSLLKEEAHDILPGHLGLNDLMKV